jgi:putative endonuclease
MEKKDLGKKGEEIAEKYLKKCGYKILEKNYRCGRLGEIDIVAFDKKTLVFVEVKTRKTPDFGIPEEAVDFRKQNKIKLLADYYLIKNKLENLDVRFDVVSIFLEKDNSFKISLLKNAF